jgi:hypothetical protein
VLLLLQAGARKGIKKVSNAFYKTMISDAGGCSRRPLLAAIAHVYLCCMPVCQLLRFCQHRLPFALLVQMQPCLFGMHVCVQFAALHAVDVLLCQPAQTEVCCSKFVYADYVGEDYEVFSQWLGTTQ